jgi:hypothetical protein
MPGQEPNDTLFREVEVQSGARTKIAMKGVRGSSSQCSRSLQGGMQGNLEQPTNHDKSACS